MMSAADAGDLDGPRPARVDELDAVLKTADYVHRILKGREPGIATQWAHIYRPENIENIVIVADGRAVTCTVGIWINDVALGDVTLRVGGINCLATLPDYRRRGLAEAVMRAAHEHMRRQGCVLGLLGTAIANWYRRLGWELAGVSLLYRFDRGNIGLLPPLPGGVTMRLADDGEDVIDEIVRLRNGDRFGGLRDRATFQLIYSSRGGRSHRAVLAVSQGQAVAYLLAREGQVSEWGGPADVVAGLVRAWAERCDDQTISTSRRDQQNRGMTTDRMDLSVPGHGHALAGRLDDLGIPCSHSYAGMMHLLDPRGVLDAFGRDDIAVEDRGDELRFSRRGASCTLPRTLAAKLLFGPERPSGFAADVLPVPFCQWPMEHV